MTVITRSLKTNLGILHASAVRKQRDKLVGQGIRIQINHDMLSLIEDADILDSKETLNLVCEELTLIVILRIFAHF